MNDQQIHEAIESLAAEEHRFWEDQARGGEGGGEGAWPARLAH